MRPAIGFAAGDRCDLKNFGPVPVLGSAAHNTSLTFWWVMTAIGAVEIVACAVWGTGDAPAATIDISGTSRVCGVSRPGPRCVSFDSRRSDNEPLAGAQCQLGDNMAGDRPQSCAPPRVDLR